MSTATVRLILQSTRWALNGPAATVTASLEPAVQANATLPVAATFCPPTDCVPSTVKSWFHVSPGLTAGGKRDAGHLRGVERRRHVVGGDGAAGTGERRKGDQGTLVAFPFAGARRAAGEEILVREPVCPDVCDGMCERVGGDAGDANRSRKRP